MPKDAKQYFQFINEKASGDNKFKLAFDYYYLCLMVGLKNQRLGNKDKVSPDYFIDYFPGTYSNISEIVIGLLISTELNRRAIDANNRDNLEQLILELIDHNSPNRLSAIGIEYLNCYAAGGLEIIIDNIPTSKSLPGFILLYHDLMNSSIEETKEV